MKKSLCFYHQHHHRVPITIVVSLILITNKQFVSAFIESRFESPTNTNNNEKGKEFWPSFDEPLPNIDQSTQTTTRSAILTTISQTIQQTTQGQLMSASSSNQQYNQNEPTTVPHYNNWQQQTTYRNVEVIGDGNYRYPYPNNNQPISNKLSEKKITDTSETYYQRQPSQNGSSYFYNMIILVLGAIGGASFLAIIVGFILIIRSRAFCFCKGQQTTASQDHINNNNTDNNSQSPDTFSSTAMIASYLNRKSRSTGNIQGGSELVTSIQQQSPAECSQMSLIKQDNPIINANTFDTSEQSSTTSKLTRSGVLNITHSESCSPYAAIQISDIKGYEITPVENKIINIENVQPGEQILKVTLPDTQTDNKTPDSDSANVSKETNEFPILRSDFGSSTTNIPTPTILETPSIASSSAFNMENTRKPQLNSQQYPLSSQQQQQPQQPTTFLSYRVDKAKPSSVLPTNAYSYRVQKSNSIQDVVSNTSSLFNFDKQNTINE